MKKNIALLLVVCLGSVFMVASVAVAIALVKNGVAGKLSTLEFVVEMAKAIAWPTAFVFFVTMFQESISDIVRKIQRVVLPGGASIDIVQVIEKTQEAAAALDSEQASQSLPSKSVDTLQTVGVSIDEGKTSLPAPTEEKSSQKDQIEAKDIHATNKWPKIVPSEVVARGKILGSQKEESGNDKSKIRSYLKSNNPSIVLVAISIATRDLWTVVFPGFEPPPSTTERWAMLKSAGALSDAEHQSLQALFNSREKLLHAQNSDDDRLIHAALHAFRSLASRMFFLLTTRTVAYREKNSSK